MLMIFDIVGVFDIVIAELDESILYKYKTSNCIEAKKVLSLHCKKDKMDKETIIFALFTTNKRRCYSFRLSFSCSMCN